MLLYILLSLLLSLLLILVYVYLLYNWYKSLTIEVFEDNSIDLVIARYSESVDWLSKLELNKFRKIFIYNKGSDLPEIAFLKNYNYEIIKLPNVGREAHTYLYHIINNYNNLANVTIFLPGSCTMDNKWDRSIETINKTITTNKSVFVATVIDLKDLYDFKIDEYRSTNKDNSNKNNESKLLECSERPFGKWYEKNFKNISIYSVCYNAIFAVSKEDIHHRSLDSYKNLIKYVDHHSNHEAAHYFERAWLAVFYPVSQDCIYS